MHDFKKNGDVYSLLKDFVLAASNGKIRLQCSHETSLPEPQGGVDENDYRFLADAFNRDGVAVGMEFTPYNINIPGHGTSSGGEISFTAVDENALAAAVEKHAAQIADIKDRIASFEAKHGW